MTEQLLPWWTGILPLEMGMLTYAERDRLFIMLIASGDIWKLPPYYVINAAQFLKQGTIGDKNRDLDS